MASITTRSSYEPGAEQPPGYVIAWGVMRKYVETQHEKRGDADKWAIQEFEPT